MKITGHLSLKPRNRTIQYEKKKPKKFRTKRRILKQNARSLNPVLNSIEYIEFNMGVKITDTQEEHVSMQSVSREISKDREWNNPVFLSDA